MDHKRVFRPKKLNDWSNYVALCLWRTGMTLNCAAQVAQV